MITLQINRTYRTRDGKSEHKISAIKNGVAINAAGESWWVFNGKKDRGLPEHSADLVEDVTPATETPAFPANGPVRQRTVTTTEIVPGAYGCLDVGRSAVGVVDIRLAMNGAPLPQGVYTVLNADELDALAQTAIQLAAGLRAIAAEQQS